MKTVALFLVMAASLHIRCCTAAAQQVPFTLVDSRATRSNIITLRCRNSNDIFDPHAIYYLNGTRLELFNGFVDTSQDPGTVVFQIKRTLEGEYSCGTEHQRSDVLSFVAFPDSTAIPPREPVHFLVGETARLQCGIQPGALAGQYFARWFNGTNERMLYNYPSPSLRLADPSQEMSESPRYTIDPIDLSLMIGNVQRNDSLESYRCEVGVEDPRSPGRVTYTYELTTSYNIALKVVAPPQIIREFRPNIVIVEEQDMTFKCIAQGYPAPTIAWQQAGRAVVNGENSHFIVNSTKRNDGFLITVISYLKLSSADDSVNGELKCIARPPPPDMVGGMALDDNCTSTQLSVLGSFNDLEIEITTKGDVIIIVNLQQALPVPIHLVLVYRDVENPSTPPDNKTTQAAYFNTAEIRHIDFASQVPFEHFTVEVGLFSQGVRGPLVRAEGEYDKDRPTLQKEILSMTTTIVIGAVPGTICLVMMVMIGLGCCIWHKQTLDYRVKCLMVKNPPKYLNTLQEHFEQREHIDIAVQEKLIDLVKAGIPQLNPDKKKTPATTYSIQTSQVNDSSMLTARQLSNQTSQRAEDTAEDDKDEPGYPEYESTSSVVGNSNHILQAPPSYEAAVSQTARDADLMNLLAGFVCDSVRATLHQDHNPELAEHVERRVKDHVYQRQKSVEENRMKQVQSLHAGTPI